MIDKEIKISAEDVTVTWDEEPEIQPPKSYPKAVALLTAAVDKSIEKSFKAALAEAGTKPYLPPSNGLESQGKGGSDACSGLPKSKDETLKLREAWLREAYHRITGQEGVISCGYGKGGSRSTKGYSVHKDETGINQIFIHPSISKKDGALIALAQAAKDTNNLYSGPGPYKDILSCIEPVASAMPPYPQHKLAENDESQKKDGIRQLKVVCPVCGYTARTSRKWLNIAGAPFCPVTHQLTKERESLEHVGWNIPSHQNPHAMFQMLEADKPIEVDLETESITKSGDTLEVKTKAQ